MSGPDAPAVDVLTPRDSFSGISPPPFAIVGHLRYIPELRPLQLALLVLGAIIFYCLQGSMVFRPEFDSIQGGCIHPRLLFPNNPQEDFATVVGRASHHYRRCWLGVF